MPRESLTSSVLLLMLGVLAASSAVTWIKLSDVHPALLAGYRLVLAALVLSPVFVLHLRRFREHYTWRYLRRSIWPAFFLGLHLSTWNQAAQWTSAPNGALIVNLSPLALPFFLYLVLRETLNRGEVIGTLISLSGLVLLKAGELAIGIETLAGDLLALFSMCLFACYLALGRKNRDFPSIWLYVIPLYAMAGLMCFAIGLPLVFLTGAEAVAGLGDVWVYPLGEYIPILGLTLIPTVVGHSMFNLALRRLRGQVVSLCNLGQFIPASLIAYAVWGAAEQPSPVFYFAVPIVVSGAILSIRAQARQEGA